MADILAKRGMENEFAKLAIGVKLNTKQLVAWFYPALLRLGKMRLCPGVRAWWSAAAFLILSTRGGPTSPILLKN